MFFIDEDYNVKLDNKAMMQVVEFSDIAENPKYGIQYLVYLFLFCSRVPFGNLKEEERDYAVSSNVYKKLGKDTAGFYKTKAFEQASKMFSKLFKDPIYEAYIQYSKDLDRINGLKEALDLSQETDIDLFNAYIDLAKKTTLLMTEAKKALEDTLRTDGDTLGLEQLREAL